MRLYLTRATVRYRLNGEDRDLGLDATSEDTETSLREALERHHPGAEFVGFSMVEVPR